MKTVNAENFKRNYNDCKTYGEWDRLMPKMEISLIKKLAESLEFTKDTVGNTLRENAFLACLKCYIKYNLQNDPLDDPITVDEMDEFLSYE